MIRVLSRTNHTCVKSKPLRKIMSVASLPKDVASLPEDVASLPEDVTSLPKYVASLSKFVTKRGLCTENVAQCQSVTKV